MYDYGLTLPEEVARYWGTRMTWGTVFFYLNRYSARFGTVPLLAEILLTTSDPSKAGVCRVLQPRYQHLLIISGRVTPFKRIIHILRELHGTRLLATERSATTLDSELKAFGCPSPTPHESCAIFSLWASA